MKKSSIMLFVVVLSLLVALVSGCETKIAVQNSGADSSGGSAESGDDSLPSVSLAYEKDIDGVSHVILNGEDLGPGKDIRLNLRLMADSKFKSNKIYFYREVDGKQHIIYDGKDYGEIDGVPSFSGDNIVFRRKIDGENHIIYNGENLGPGFGSAIAGDNIVYTRYKGDQKEDKEVVYNGIVVGESTAQTISYTALGTDGIDMGFVATVEGEKHVFYNGKDMGEGYSISVSGDNIFVLRKIGEEKHVFRNGEDLGVMNTNFIHSGDNIVFQQSVDDKDYIIYNGENIGLGRSPELYKDHLVFFREKDGNNLVVYNGEELCETHDYLPFAMKSFGKPSINSLGKDVVFDCIIDGESHIFHNGKDIGEGIHPKTFGDNMAFLRKNRTIDMEYNNSRGETQIQKLDVHDVIFNGENIGPGELFYLFGDNIAVVRSDGTEDDGPNFFNIIFNGEDLGKNYDMQIQMSGNSIGFERKVGDAMHLIYNGEDMGNFVQKEAQFSFRMVGDDMAFEQEVNGESHIIYNGEDLGLGRNPWLFGSGINPENSLDLFYGR